MRQLLRWSILGWLLTLALSGFYFVVSDRGFTDALFGGALFASVALLGIGAMSLGGGGMSWMDPSGGARRRELDRWDEEGALLTPFGVSLLVIPQLLGVAYLLARLID